VKIIKQLPYWNLHSHSQYSHKDALPEVADMVRTVVKYRQPALGLTDHGNMAGSVQLYKECRKNGILPFPGSELYFVPDRQQKKAKRHHFCVVAYTTKGYENLVNLSTLTHKNFYNKPLIDIGDLAALHDQGLLEGIAATSGCYFSYISQGIVHEYGDESNDEVRATLKLMANWFPKFYVELQNHNIDHGDGWSDDRLAGVLHGMAVELGLPVVLTQDSHYCHLEDKPIHETLKRIVAFGTDEDDAVFPGDGFHLADAQWIEQHHSGSRLHDGIAGLTDLLEAHELVIPELESYHYNIPFTVADPNDVLAKRCEAELIARGKANPAYQTRLDSELEIVRDTGMAGYLILVAEVTDWCQSNAIFYQARGSATGSVLCWLLNITQHDPLRWGLRFDRFISRDRTKPPDIDLDIEYDRRKDLIEWLKTRFATIQIGTWADYKLRGEITEEGEEAQGSLRVAYFARKRITGQEINTWADIPQEDKDALYALDSASAKKSYGTHAAGLVVTTTTHDYERLVPLMWIASAERLVTQYEMDDIEALGLVKLDVLGLKTLSILHRCMDNLGRSVYDGLDWIPLRDTKALGTIGKGYTDGVFQLEGGSSRRGCRDLKPTKITDIIAAMALFRPATMDSGATASYIARKHHQEQIPSRHQIIRKHTEDTYGIMLFQEQVIGILRDLGMNSDDLTSFLKAIKASQKAEIEHAEKVMREAQGEVEKLAAAAGMIEDDFLWLWNAIEGFSKYGFNQAHSTAYGITAYRCAYLAVHHPVEFYAALLAVAAESGSKKEALYLKAARHRDIRVLQATVNDSLVTYSVDRRKRAIRKGLMAIKFVGERQAEEIVSLRPDDGFQSMEHFCETLIRPKSPVTGLKAYLKDKDLSVGTVARLYEAGALGCLGVESHES